MKICGSRDRDLKKLNNNILMFSIRLVNQEFWEINEIVHFNAHTR